MRSDKSRRRFLRELAGAGLAALPLAHLSNLAFAQTVQPTPACDDGDEPAPAQTEGPFFTPDSPERTNFREAGMAGTPILLTGFVLSLSCRPIPKVLVDLWHCDDSGEYDNEGYRLRGHQFTDASGLYRFETIVPGLYPGRTRHFHIKFQAPGQPVLTTQLYFPEEPDNQNDGLFRPELLLALSEGTEKTGRFDAVLDLA